MKCIFSTESRVGAGEKREGEGISKDSIVRSESGAALSPMGPKPRVQLDKLSQIGVPSVLFFPRENTGIFL